MYQLKTIEGHKALVTSSKNQVKVGKFYYESDNNIPLYSFTIERLPIGYYLQEVIAAEPFLIEKYNLKDPKVEKLERMLATYGNDDSTMDIYHIMPLMRILFALVNC